MNSDVLASYAHTIVYLFELYDLHCKTDFICYMLYKLIVLAWQLSLSLSSDRKPSKYFRVIRFLVAAFRVNKGLGLLALVRYSLSPKMFSKRSIKLLWNF